MSNERKYLTFLESKSIISMVKGLHLLTCVIKTMFQNVIFLLDKGNKKSIKERKYAKFFLLHYQKVTSKTHIFLSFFFKFIFYVLEIIYEQNFEHSHHLLLSLILKRIWKYLVMNCVDITCKNKTLFIHHTHQRNTIVVEKQTFLLRRRTLNHRN
jgi:hypothetical protein